MKAYGDVPAEHLELVQELEELEKWLRVHGTTMPLDIIAQSYVCIAHDYYSIYFDEKGEELLRKAEKTFPGYFKKRIKAQTLGDAEFAQLVRQLEEVSAVDVMVSLGYEE